MRRLGGKARAGRKGRDGGARGWLGALAIVLLAHGAILFGYRHWHRERLASGPPSPVEVTLVAPLPRVERPRPAPLPPRRAAPVAPPRPQIPTPAAAPQPAAIVPPEQAPPVPPQSATAQAPTPAVAVPASAPPAAVSAQPVWAPPQFAPAYLHNPPPAYPAFARRHGMEGRVLVSARVGAHGICLEAKLAHGSGYPILDQAAVEAVRNWHFVPARRGSQAEPAWVEVPIVFKLKD